MNNNLATIDTVNFKFLGFIGDKFIASSLNNDRIVIMNQSDFEAVELVESVTIDLRRIKIMADSLQHSADSLQRVLDSTRKLINGLDSLGMQP